MSDDKRYEKARLHADRIQDQDIEQFADELRGLMADSPGLLRGLTEILNETNADAARALSRMPRHAIETALQFLIPAARIGWYQALFVMEDKYTPDKDSPSE